jgi:hypothetical protein
MKRIRNRERYRRHQARRLSAVLAERVRAGLRKRALGTPQGAAPRPRASGHAVRPWGYKQVRACPDLSMINNPEHTIAFFNELMDSFDRRRRTWVVLKDVGRIDYDAILVLLSIMVRFKVAGIKFNGDFPEDAQTAAVLRRSGFLESLYRPFSEQDVYTVQTTNRIRTHANRSVDSALGAELINQASKTVWGTTKRLQGVQRALLELMHNTNNHASLRRQGEKHWWVSVTHRPQSKKASFAFVDLGVGIFRSLESKPSDNKWFGSLRKLKELWKPTDNAQILKLILEGELHRTVTQQSFRGKGLPGIREALQRGWLTDLVIISNDVYANVATDSYRVLKNPFPGTLVSWELNQDNRSTA